LRDFRKPAVVLLFLLCVLTILACLPLDPQGPFDARDYSRVAGMRLEQHGLDVFLGPFAAPLLILGGAPDFQVACISVFVWLFLGTAAWGVLAELRARRRGKSSPGASMRAVLLGGTRKALVTCATVGLLILLFVLGRVPGWRLVVDAPDLIVADLHCHTTKSHDAVVSLETNLEWHASCGYNLVALTEHDQLLPMKSHWPQTGFRRFFPASRPTRGTGLCCWASAAIRIFHSRGKQPMNRRTAARGFQK
jgi:hypothetical protein